MPNYSVVRLTKPFRSLPPRQLARLVLGASLLGSILWTSLPASTAMSGPMCTLACCAGRAPHAAGSCMNGSCHVNLSGRKSANAHHQPGSYKSEQLCGLPRFVARVAHLRATAIVGADQANGKLPANQNTLTASSLGQPCQPDCGRCLSGFANSGRKRDAATLTSATRLRTPSRVGRAVDDGKIIRNLDSQFSLCGPRGPPPSFS